jgi:hypothetical protein
MVQRNSVAPKVNPSNQAVTRNDFLFLASLVDGKETIQRVQKKSPHGAALRSAGELYADRDYVAALESFMPAYAKVVADMQRVLTRNSELEASKLAKEQRKPLDAAKEIVQKKRVHAQQVIDQLDRLRRDLESKPAVRMHQKRVASGTDTAAAPEVKESPPTTLSSTSETRLEANSAAPHEFVIGGERYIKAPYAPPEKYALYSVHDKAKGERIIRVVATSPDGKLVQVEILDAAKPAKHSLEITVESLARQAVKGWCRLLRRDAEHREPPAAAGQPAALDSAASGLMRLDSQNFGRCCADIARANIRFDTQLIKDVGDGPFRAGNYEQAFRIFEQCAVSFTSAVASSRRAIADGRRLLNAEKGKLSGKEILERTAAFTRGEQLIHTAEREFSTILEGLRMYLRSREA